MKHPMLLMRMMIETGRRRVLGHPQEGWAQVGLLGCLYFFAGGKGGGTEGNLDRATVH